MTGNHSLLWEQHRFTDTAIGIICQGITPYSGNNTCVWVMCLGLYDMEPLPTVGNNTTVWIMYFGLHDRESFPTLGNNITVWIMYLEYMTGNHSLLWEQHRCRDNVFVII